MMTVGALTNITTLPVMAYDPGFYADFPTSAAFAFILIITGPLLCSISLVPMVIV